MKRNPGCALVPGKGRFESLRCFMDEYLGRFAPSPTGPLHAGSLVAALASWLDARAQGGRWIVRIEDVDTQRCRSGVAEYILWQLARCGLHGDAQPLYQSTRLTAYHEALHSLVVRGWAYPCGCSRKDIAAASPQHREPGAESVYPGTCRSGLGGKPARSWRFRVDGALSHWAAEAAEAVEARTAQTGLTTVCIVCLVPDPAEHGGYLVQWYDRRLGAQRQSVPREVGDFVVQRVDGDTAYQLAVVVDDAWQGVTNIVRGEDLADNTARQCLLQRALGYATPRYLHVPLVRDALGRKLSKHHGAPAIDATDPLPALRTAAAVLGIVPNGSTLPEWLADAVRQWRLAWGGRR